MASKHIKIRPWHLVGGVFLYGGSTYGIYSYLTAHKIPSKSSKTSDSKQGTCSGSAFDVIADRYDAAVGAEEWGMAYPLLRKWLLNHARGDVLEISAGTGRNLPHYRSV